MTKTRYFEPALFAFLRELDTHNDRDWFERNRERYDKEVRAPMTRFIEAANERTRRINRHIAAGRMLRIYRDARFVRDARPFKAGPSAQFRHVAASAGRHVPAFILRIAPGECAIGGGIQQPAAKSVAAIRKRIMARPEMWNHVKKPAPVGERTLLTTELTTMFAFSDKDVCSPAFLEDYTDVCRATAPLLKFLCHAEGLPW